MQCSQLSILRRASVIWLILLVAHATHASAHSRRRAQQQQQQQQLDNPPSAPVQDPAALIAEAWRQLLKELDNLAQPQPAAGNTSHTTAGPDVSKAAHQSNTDTPYSLDNISLLMAEDLLRRMSQRWRGQSPAPAPESSGPDAATASDAAAAFASSADTEPPTGSTHRGDGSGPLDARSGVDSDDQERGSVPGGSSGGWLGGEERVADLGLSTVGAETGGTAASRTGEAASTRADGVTAGSIARDGADTTVEQAEVGAPPAGVEAPGGRRRLLQVTPTGGAMYANAFRLIFGNFFDFVDGARRFLATLAAETTLLLTNVHFIRDLAYLATAPLDNIINSNTIPLPQSISQLRTLLRTALNDFCTAEAVVPSELRLGEYRGPTFALAITPASCPVLVDERTGRRRLDWDRCTPARLTLTLTPRTYIGKRYTAATYRGKFCRYSRAFGTDTMYRLGGGRHSYTFRGSSRQLDIVPVLNQFFLRGLFSPFIADNLNFGNVTGGPVGTAASTNIPANTNGSNTAFIFRSAAEAAADAPGGGGARDDELVALQDDDPLAYVSLRQYAGNSSGSGDKSAEAGQAAPSPGAERAEGPVLGPGQHSPLEPLPLPTVNGAGPPFQGPLPATSALPQSEVVQAPIRTEDEEVTSYRAQTVPALPPPPPAPPSRGDEQPQLPPVFLRSDGAWTGDPAVDEVLPYVRTPPPSAQEQVATDPRDAAPPDRTDGEPTLDDPHAPAGGLDAVRLTAADAGGRPAPVAVSEADDQEVLPYRRGAKQQPLNNGLQTGPGAAPATAAVLQDTDVQAWQPLGQPSAGSREPSGDVARWLPQRSGAAQERQQGGEGRQLPGASGGTGTREKLSYTDMLLGFLDEVLGAEGG